jgi:hypothetical protein
LKFTCPCCGYKTLDDKPPGSFNICSVCHWEDDDFQFQHPDIAEGANHVSLREAQENYRKFGACHKRYVRYARPPRSDEIKDPSWTPLN